MDSPVAKELPGVTAALPEAEPVARLVARPLVEFRWEPARHVRAEAMAAQELVASVSEAPCAVPRLARAGHEMARPSEALLALTREAEPEWRRHWREHWFAHLRVRAEQQRPRYTRRIESGRRLQAP